MERPAILVLRNSLDFGDPAITISPTTADFHHATTIDEVEQLIRQGLAPTMIVISERWPGDLPRASVHNLQALAPLARIWRIASPWCEGEMRTAPPEPGTLRSYWHQAEARLAEEIHRLAGNQPSRSTQPLTMTDEERTLALGPMYAADKTRLVVIQAVEREAGLALLDACQACGFCGMWLKELRGVFLPEVDAVLCDLRADELGDPAVIRRLRVAVGDAPVVGVVGFPRPHDFERARQCGFAAVISKPLELSELAWQLQQVCQQRSA